MHPLIARIRPSLRTGFTAWLLSRGLVWAILWARAGQSVLAPVTDPTFGNGSPLWTSWIRGLESTDLTPLNRTLLVVGVNELALLVGAIALYRYIRKNELPQNTDRAIWFWMLSPIMLWTLPASAMTLAACMAAVALLALELNYVAVSTAVFCLGLGLKPELLLLWPGMAYRTWSKYRSGNASVGRFAGQIAGPVASFTAVVGAAVLSAGRYGLSVRGTGTDTTWRSFSTLRQNLDLPGASWAKFQQFATQWGDDLFFGLTAGLFVFWFIKHRKKMRTGDFLMTLPCLCWPLLFSSPVRASGILLFGFPLMVLLARSANSQTSERQVTVISIGSFLVGTVFVF